MAWGAIGGSVLGAGLSLGSQALAQNYAKQNYKHRYRWAMKDAKKAGLNPLLIHNLAGNVTSPGHSTMAGPDLNKAFSNVTERNKAKDAARTSASQRGLLEAQANKALGDRIVSTESAKLLQQQTLEAKARTVAIEYGLPYAKNQAELQQWLGAEGTRAQWMLQNVATPVTSAVGAFVGGRLSGGGKKNPAAGTKSAIPDRGIPKRPTDRKKATQGTWENPY